MGNVIRLFLGTPVAIVVTVVLFLFMYFLISSGDLDLNEDAQTIRIEIGRQIEDTPDQTAQAEFERPQLDSPPPPPPAINDANFRPEVSGVRAAAPTFDTQLDIGNGFNPDRNAQPLVRIPPEYPDRCQSRSGELETVVIEFESMAKAKEIYESGEYQAIIGKRLGATSAGYAVLVEGFRPPGS